MANVITKSQPSNQPQSLAMGNINKAKNAPAYIGIISIAQMGRGLSRGSILLVDLFIFMLIIKPF